MTESVPVRAKLAEYFTSTGKVPASLEDVGLAAKLADGSQVAVNPRNMVVTINTASGELILVPSADADRNITWSCTNGKGLTAAQLPASCR